MDWVRHWVEESPYARALGVVLERLSEETADIALPYRDENSNPGKALHGGCAASLIAMAGQAVTRAALGQDAGPFHTAGAQVNYLKAAIGEDIVGRGRLLRRGREMCFVETRVETRDGTAIAQGTSLIRARMGAAPAQLPETRGDAGAADPGAMGPHVGKMPFTQARGLEVLHMRGGTSRIVMPLGPNNADASGGVHEGAVIALFDTTGAMASWAETGPGRFKASTPALQVQILAPPVEEDLVAYGRLVHRDEMAFWADVEVAGQATRRVVARGTVLYRIVV